MSQQLELLDVYALRQDVDTLKRIVTSIAATNERVGLYIQYLDTVAYLKDIGEVHQLEALTQMSQEVVDRSRADFQDASSLECGRL